MFKFAAFLAQVERAPAAGYVLAGEESFLRAEAERAVVTAVCGAGAPGPAYVVIDGLREGGVPVEPSAVLDEVRTPSLFAPRKVVSLRRADALVKKHLDLFEAYLAEPRPTGVLVAHVERWDKRSAYARRLDRFAVDCSSLYETAFGTSDISAGSPLGRWIEGRAAPRGLHLSPPGIVRLVELVGTNLAELDGALERLELSGARSRTIGPEQVETVAAPSHTSSQFRVAELVTRGRTKEAFAAAAGCFEMGLADERGRVEHTDSGVAARLLWAIGRELELLYGARGLIEERAFDASAAGRLGIPPFRMEPLGAAARALGLEGLGRALQKGVDAEDGLKSGAVDPRFAVERLILEVGAALSPAAGRERP